MIISRRWNASLMIVMGFAASLTMRCAANAAEDVNLSLDWIVSGTHAGYFVAKDKNFYSEKGLSVTISRGFGSGDTVKRVASHTATFGVADSATVIAARANDDIPVRIIAIVYDRSATGIIYLKESGIKKPKDLEGRTIGRSASGASVNLFPAFLKANNLDRSKIKEVVTDASALPSLLLSGRIDAILDQSTNLPKYAKGAKEQGKTVLSMLYSDFGLKTYGNALITQPDTLRDKPEIVRAFVEASLRGIAYAFDHPDEAVAIVRKTHPEIDSDVTKAELLSHKALEGADEVRQHGLGYVDPEQMRETIHSITSALSLKRERSVDDLYAPGFLPKTGILPSGL